MTRNKRNVSNVDGLNVSDHGLGKHWHSPFHSHKTGGIKIGDCLWAEIELNRNCQHLTFNEWQHIINASVFSFIPFIKFCLSFNPRQNVLTTFYGGERCQKSIHSVKNSKNANLNVVCVCVCEETCGLYMLPFQRTIRDQIYWNRIWNVRITLSSFFLLYFFLISMIYLIHKTLCYFALSFYYDGYDVYKKSYWKTEVNRDRLQWWNSTSKGKWTRIKKNTPSLISFYWMWNLPQQYKDWYRWYVNVSIFYVFFDEMCWNQLVFNYAIPFAAGFSLVLLCLWNDVLRINFTGE